MSSSLFIQTLTTLRPAAVAKIQGDTANPVRGYATFYNTYTGDFHLFCPIGDSGTKIAPTLF